MSREKNGAWRLEMTPRQTTLREALLSVVRITALEGSFGAEQRMHHSTKLRDTLEAIPLGTAPIPLRGAAEYVCHW
jgi:hypothetical protein